MRIPLLETINLPVGSGRLLRAENWETPFEQKIRILFKVELFKDELYEQRTVRIDSLVY